jgi:CRP-like cAMP-binding protein
VSTKAETRELKEALAQTELFREMSPKEIEVIAGQARITEHAAGQEITSEGRAGAGFHLVLEGTAVVEARDPVELPPGSYFGEISLIDGGPRTATVRAQTDVRTAVLSPWSFGPILQDHPKMALGLLRGLCARLRATDAVPEPRIAG